MGQYLWEYSYICLHGNLVHPLFDSSIGMGEDIIGTLDYYGFGDPLNVLAVFATKENGAMQFLFSIYDKSFFWFPIAVIGSVM